MMLNNSSRDKVNENKANSGKARNRMARLIFAVVMSVAMLVSMVPGTGASANRQSSNVSEQGGGQVDSLAHIRPNPNPTYSMTYTVSFALPSGYSYSDGTRRFAVSVSAGDSVSKESIPVIAAEKGEVFRGWETQSEGSAMILTREQIANQPVTDDVDYTAVFEKKASNSGKGGKSKTSASENNTGQDSPASVPLENNKRGVTPKQAPSTTSFNVNKPLGGGSVTSDASSIHVFGAGVEMIFTPTANNNSARNTALKDAVNWLAANGDNKDWVMYLPYTGTSYVYYPTTNVSFSNLSSVRTLAITGNANDPVGSTADDPATAQPAAEQNTGGYSFLSESADVNFGCNVILRNISYAAANIYMNGHDITLGHYSFSTRDSFVFGGAASGTVSGDPAITVYSTGKSVMTLVGGMRVGTLNGDAEINVRGTGNGRLNVFGAGYGTGTAAANRANLNGTATTTITRTTTSTAADCGLGTFAGGVQYGDVSGKITNTISGPGRFYYNLNDNGWGANDSVFRNSFFMGGSCYGDIGSASTRGSTIIENNVDTSGWVYGQGPYVGTNTDTGTIYGNIENTVKAGDYQKGSFSGMSFGSGMNTGFNNNTFDYRIFNVSWNASTGTLHIPGVAAARAAAEQKFPYRLYGNLTNNILSGCVYSTWDWERHVRGAGYGYVEGNATTNVGTEGLVYSGTHRNNSAMWNVNSKHYKYAADTNYSNNNQGNRAGLEFAGGGGWPTGNNSIFLVGDTELNIYETVANWVYGSNFGGEHIGNAEVNLYGGVCDTLEGGSHNNYVRVGNTRATVHGGQVDWFLSGGGWRDSYTIGNASVEVFDSDYDPVNHPVIINASMGGTYGDANPHVYTGDADITVHGGDFSGAARDLPRRGFSPGPTNDGYILGDATMTLDLRGNKNGFKLAAGDTVSAARRYEADNKPVLGKNSSNTVTLNVFADAGAGDLLKGLNIYGDAARANPENTRAGKMTINVNAPGATIGNLYASRYSNLDGNHLRRDVTINLVSAKEVEGITSCGPNDNITNTSAAVTANKAAINIGPQPEPAGWDSRPTAQGGDGEWPLTNHEPGLASNGFPRRINVLHNGIRNFTKMSVDDRLIIAESGGILNGKDATADNHRSAYDSFGDVTLKDESGLGVNSGDFIAGKLVVEEDGFVASPGKKNEVVFSDVDFKDARSNLTWLRTPYVGSGSMPATTGMSTDWFNVTEGWPVITLNTGQTGMAGKTNVEKLTPANFKGQDISGGRTYIGDTDTHYTSGDPDKFSGYGVCIAGSFYKWKVVPGSDNSSLGKIAYDVVDHTGSPVSGSVSIGVRRPSATTPYIDVYGTSPRNTPTTSGSIAIPSSKNFYGKFAFTPDAATGEWAKDITVARSDRYDELENPPNELGKGLYDYHEFEQSVSDYYDTNKRTRVWAAAASGRPTGSYIQPAVNGTLPSSENDKNYSFDITADYTSVSELNARSVILRESDARSLVADATGNPKPDADIIAAIRGPLATNVEGRPFLTDDIVPSYVFDALSRPLAPNEHSRLHTVTYYTHNVNSNATSGSTVTGTKTRQILVVPDEAQVTTGAALVAYDTDMMVKDAQAITSQRGDSTPKNNIDYWTDSHAYIISPLGYIQEVHPTLAHSSAKVSEFQGTTAKSLIDLSYEFTSPPPYNVPMTENVTAKIVGAMIDGTIWVDANGNGSIDSAEADRFIGKNVKLYAQDGTLIDSTITDAYGMYSFGAYGTAAHPIPEVPEGNLHIVFPDLSSYGMTTHGTARRQDLTVSYTTAGQYDYRGANGFNGGYKWPDMAGLGNSFSKKVYDAALGSYVDNLKITDSDTVLQYRMQFALPGSLTGYGSLTIKDIMPAGLVYASGETDPFVIRIGGSGPGNGTPYAVSSAGIAVNPAHTEVSYSISDFSNLAGKTVNVYIKAKLAKVGGAYPGTVENKGRILVNAPSASGSSELTASDPLPPGGLVGGTGNEATGPAISNVGVISGSAFDDANKNGARDSTEAGIANVGVEIYAKSGGNYHLTDSTVTAADGSYRFEVPAGIYLVEFETPLVTGSLPKNITTSPPGNAGADGKTGDIVISLTSAADQHKTASAGYAVTSNDPPTLTVDTPVEIQKGGVFATMAGVSATDTEDGNITAKARLSSGSAVVDTNTVGLYHLVYEVTDSDNNRVTASRVVVVNDGTYVVNPLQDGRILKASSFVAKLDDVTTNSALLDDDIMSKSGTKLYDGKTGAEISSAFVENAGGYHRAAGYYPITVAGIDTSAAQGRITKRITGKVVDANVIVGPSTPATSGAVYYAYGKNLFVTVAEAAALNTDALLLQALEAHADKVYPSGVITDAGVRVKSVSGPPASPNAFSSSVGTYNVTIADSANPEHVTAVLHVSVSTGNHPVLTLVPMPLVFQVTTAASLTSAQIMSGATATDIEDDADTTGTRHTTVTVTSITASGQAISSIPADRAGVYQATYTAEDSDGNTDVESRAIIVNDGSISIIPNYVLQAKSFIIGLSEVDTVTASTQVKRKSEAGAWNIDGSHADSYVKDDAGYGIQQTGSYFPKVAVTLLPVLEKRVEARVVDDADFSYNNGGVYSILAKRFRINLADAAVLAANSGGASYGAEFISRAAVTGFDRTGSGLSAVANSVKLDGAVVKKNGPGQGRDFSAAGFANGDIYLATFSIIGEPGTKVTVEVLVSSENPPQLTVPAHKSVPVGAAFPEGAYADAQPSYMQGVSASDIEDGAIPPSAISHSSPVDTTTGGAFLVEYSVTDSDHNTVTQGGVVLVGGWAVVSGYAIMAYDFSKEIGDVQGTDAEIISESAAKAIDLRQTMAGGGANPVPNPNYGKLVPVSVKNDAGAGDYRTKKLGTHDITISVDDPANPASRTESITISATIGNGSSPAITFEEAPLVVSNTTASSIMTSGGIKAKLQVTDAEDYPVWDASAGPQQQIFNNVTYKIYQDGHLLATQQIDRQNVGVYKVEYTATDSHGNQTTDTRAVVVDDGRYVINDADNGGIIIGARDFVIMQSDVQGTMGEALSHSYAEAYNIIGDKLSGPVWTGAPNGYVAHAPIGDYTFVWSEPGYSTTKSIVGKVTSATVVDPGTKNSRYALIASDFLRNTAQAAAMIAGNLDAELISAANAQVIKLVASAPDRAPRVVQYGDALSGPFAAVQNTYPIQFGVVGMPDSSPKAEIDAVISNGYAPVLTVSSPLEIQKGNPFTTLAGVVARDTEDGNITSNTVIAAGSDIVDTNAAGIYKLTYEVTDSDYNTVTAPRVVVVNDGRYVVNNNGRIFEAHSFVTKLSDVATDSALLNGEIKSKSGSKLYDGKTGALVDMGYVEDSGGYHHAAGDYRITVAGIDVSAASGRIAKNITGKVVDAGVIVGPSAPGTNGEVYYAYGNDLSLTVGEAAALNTDALLLAALNAHTDKVYPDGTVTDAGVRVKGVAGPAASPNSFGSAVGTYEVTIADSANPEHVTAKLTVHVSTGNPPVLSLVPVPLEYQATSAAVNLTRAQIMSGATAYDVEDDADPNKHVTITATSITVSGQAVSAIPADRAGVYKVSYKAIDSDGNEDTASRAVIVNDGSMVANSHYILQAKPFVIGVSEVSPGAVSEQILLRSGARAWDTNGDPVPPQVSDPNGYGVRTIGDYFPKLIPSGHTSLEKQIQAKVVDDSATRGNNGNLYSIIASDFRINLADAAALAGRSPASYAADMIARAAAEGYIRTGSSLSHGGTVELGGAVVKKDNPGQGNDFRSAGFANGDIYLATFRIAEEPGTQVTINILVSNSNPPALFVPAYKRVSVGAAFPEGAYADAQPSYMQGVSASDIEDGAISPSAISHDTPVDTTTGGAFIVEYSVTDSDHNTVTQGGVVLVGAWSVASGYAIMAHDFSKSVGEVQGTEAEIISASAARAIDLRQTLAGSGANPAPTPNPNYGKSVPVRVEIGTGANGYYAKNPGSHYIEIAVDDPANPASGAVKKGITANVGNGQPPKIEFEDYPLVVNQATASSIMTDSELKAKLRVTDAEDYPTWDPSSGRQQQLFINTTAASLSAPQIDKHNIGVYRVRYTATDSHGNQAVRDRAVIVTDGRYVWDVTDDGNDNNDIIIGARDYVIKQSAVLGTDDQAGTYSFAEAYTALGEQRIPHWKGGNPPAGYVAQAAPGDYHPMIWTVAGYQLEKPVKAIVVNADDVNNGGKNSQYGISANHFWRNIQQARDIELGGSYDSDIISAAAVKVYRLVPSAPSASPQVLSTGTPLPGGTGPFRGAQNDYPIRFAVSGVVPAQDVNIQGKVSDGMPPSLSVDTPKSVSLGGVYGRAEYMDGAHATDPDGDKHGSGNPADWTQTDITSRVKFGVVSGGALAEGTPVVTTVAGLYGVDYQVTDDDGNSATAHRVVVVNNGSMIVGTGDILHANSFVTKIDDVTAAAGNIKSELRSKSGARAWNGETGHPFTLTDANVANDGGYRKAAGEYTVTFDAPDRPTGSISKSITAKVVSADAIQVGPQNPGPTDTDRYYVYGNNISLTISEAQAIVSTPGGTSAYERALLGALGAHADKVTAAGQISDANAALDSDGGFAATAGAFTIRVKDAGGNAHLNLTATVRSGNPPELTAYPVPLVIAADRTASGNLTKAQIFQGVRVKDAEDTNNILTDWDMLASSKPQVAIAGSSTIPAISVSANSVTQVTYSYTDADGNKVTASRAIVVNDGRYLIDKGYILEANSFVIGRSQVATANPNGQILSKSGARAWMVDGTPATAEVKADGGYTDVVQDYTVRMGVFGVSENDLSKSIQARVFDDSTPPGGNGGGGGGNGDRYSITANNFRVNLTDAMQWQSDSAAAYEARFVARATPQSFIRAALQPVLVQSGTPELVGVEKAAPPNQGADFKTAQLGEGDVYLATFRVKEEPGTTVTIRVLVSDGNKPVLTVPAMKQVSVGAVFNDGNWGDPATAPNYRGGVTANDVEDIGIINNVAYDTPVNTSTVGAFKVTYSVVDSDHNTVTQGGMVLVGGWLAASGYAIIAHDFTKQIGDVQSVSDTDAQIVSASGARAIDARQTLANGSANPDFGKQVPVKVKSDGGYSSKNPAEYDVELMVDDPSNQASNAVVQSIKARIDAGSPPTIAFTEEPLMVSQSAVSYIMTEMDIKSKMQVTDPDDNPTWEASDTSLPIFRNPVTSGATGLPYGTSYEIWQGGASGAQVPSIDTHSVGVYRVDYTTIDSHGNKVEKSRAIIVTDGRYIVDKNDDTIIGARGFVIARSAVDGSETQAKSRSYAEAFNLIGDQLLVKWTGIPTMVGNPGVSYAAQAQVGDYIFTWKVDGRTATKSIKGIVSDATAIDPGTKDSQYAMMASDFTKTTLEARTMASSGDIASALIAAARARVVKLVDTAPDAVIGLVSNGTPLPGGTGPFSPTPNTYPIRFGLAGHGIDELKAIVNGVVLQGNMPTLTVSTPVEIWTGQAAQKPASSILPAEWAAANGMHGVSASDQEDGDITTGVAIAAGSDTVDTTANGIYKLTYTVTDSDGGTVSEKRVVVVNDGRYAIGRSRILAASSFEIGKANVATAAALKETQIKGLSGVTLYDGATGNVIDDTAVRNDGGYTNAAGEYSITMGGRDPQEPSGWITRPITGKVVDSTVLVGPQGPGASGNIYYVRGDDIELTSGQARALASDDAIMNALNAAADKVSPSGQVTDAGRKLVSVAPSKSALQSGQIGIYSVVVSDAASPYNATGTFTIRVVGGNAPSISAPSPIVIPVDPSASGNVGRNSIVSGVTADDVEDGDLTGSIVIDPDSRNHERLPSIPANKAGVYQVTFFVEDSDGNQCSTTRAVVLDDGRVVIGSGYILQARSFFIGLSEVTTTDAAVQILDRSDAKAWDTNGATAAAIVQSTGSYGAAAGDYFPVISVQGQPSIYKQIQATVVDDSNTQTQNGDRYSIAANNFRINLGTAATWQQLYGTAQFAQLFIANANAVSYLRTGTLLTPSGQAELDGLVVKKSNPSIRFESATLADGDIYLATFRAKDEPNTKVTVEVLVSNANRPVLTVPNHKVVPVGAPFPEGAYADTNPSYMQGVMATDIEDGSLSVTHNTPVDTTTDGAFLVTYSTTDSDNNNVTKASMVLVGSWSVASGYAIIAHDFTKRVGQVTGTSGEAISYARARAIDLRATVNGQPNPKFGAPAAVTVTNLGGYSAAVGSYKITYAVADEPSCSIEKDAAVVASGLPSLTVPGMKKIASGQPFDENTTNPSYMSGVSAADPEDGNITANVTHDYTVVPGVDGAYKVTYGVADSDGNLVTKAGIVLVGDWKDGRDYAIIAHDFSKDVGQVTGTDAEMIGSAMAEAVCINPANPDFGKSGTVTVASDGGYSSRTVGSFRITFATSEDSTARTTITATVGGGMPTLTVPPFKQVSSGAVFAGSEYMSGVSATDAEDGDITTNVSHTGTVNTSTEGYYAVDYQVTDSDGNTAHATTIVLVGAWTVKSGYAINAYDFSKRVSQVLGTEPEMRGAARVQAVCVEQSDPSFGKAVPVSVTNDGGYPSKQAGIYQISFGVQADLSVAKTIKATVTRGRAPILAVPPVRISPQYAGFNYMQGVGASDAEDGDITVKVIYNSTVNTNEPGAYRVTYSVTDSDGNSAYKNGLALVGYGWTEKGGYAIYAQDFAKKLSEITGTPSEAMRLARAQAVWTASPSALDFGKYVPVAIKDAGGYEKKAGNYDIEFTVLSDTSVTKKARASISDDAKKPPITNVTERNTNKNTNTTVTQPAPNVTVNATSSAAQPPAPQDPAAPGIGKIIVTTPEAVLTNPKVQGPNESVAMTDVDAPPRANGVARDSWSLIDLLLALGSLILGIYLLIAAIRRKGDGGDDGDDGGGGSPKAGGDSGGALRKDDDKTGDPRKDDDESGDPRKERRDRQIRMWGQLGILLGIASVIILLLTQRFDGKFIIADLWAILFGLIFGVEVLATIDVNRHKDEEHSEERDI